MLNFGYELNFIQKFAPPLQRISRQLLHSYFSSILSSSLRESDKLSLCKDLRDRRMEVFFLKELSLIVFYTIFQAIGSTRVKAVVI